MTAARGLEHPELCARNAKTCVSVNCIPINTVKEINWDFLPGVVHTILADGRYQSPLKHGHSALALSCHLHFTFKNGDSSLTKLGTDSKYFLKINKRDR